MDAQNCDEEYLNATMLRNLPREDLLRFAMCEPINSTQSNDEIIRVLLLNKPKGVPRKWLDVLRSIPPLIDLKHASASKSTKDHVSTGSLRREGERSHVAPSTIPQCKSQPNGLRTTQRELQNETVANRNGAHVDSSSMPADTAGIKNEPTYAASTDIPESTPLTNRPREDSPPGPARKAFGVLYEEEEILSVPVDGALAREGARNPATNNVNAAKQQQQHTPEGLPSKPIGNKTLRDDTFRTRGATKVAEEPSKSSGMIDTDSTVPPHPKVPLVSHSVERTTISVSDSEEEGDSDEEIPVITQSLWESVPSSMLKVADEWMLEVEDEIFGPRVMVQLRPRPVISEPMDIESKRERVMGLIQMEIDDEDDEELMRWRPGHKRPAMSKKEARAREAEAKATLEKARKLEIELRSKRQILAKKMQRAWHQRRQIEEAKAWVQTCTENRNVLEGILAKKTESLHKLQGLADEICLSTALDRSMRVDVPAQEGPTAGSSKHRNAYFEEDRMRGASKSGGLPTTPKRPASKRTSKF